MSNIEDAWESADERLRHSPTADVDLRGELSQSTVEMLRLLNRAFELTEDCASEHQALPSQIGRYSILEVIGRGHYGIVYKGLDPQSSKFVAIKCIRPEFIDSPEHRRRFVREAEIVAHLDHPDIVRILDAGRDCGIWYIVFAYCEGNNLEQWLVAHRSTLTPKLSAQIVMQVALTVQHGHDRGIVHRDLKPSNVMMTPDADSPSQFRPKLLDFGFARSLNTPIRETASAMVVGTPLYMAPEQSTGAASPISPATDVFAMGTILYEMLAGAPPFGGQSVLEIVERLNRCDPSRITHLDEIDRGLEDICRKCLEKAPGDRYENGAALARDLNLWLECRHPLAMNTVRPSACVKSPRCVSFARHRRRFMSSAVGLASLAAIGGYWCWPYMQRHSTPLANTVARRGRRVAPLSERDSSTETETALQRFSMRTDAAIDRQIAELVLTLGGVIDVTFHGESNEVKKISDLPAEPFSLTWIMMPRCKTLKDSDVAEFSALQSLVGIDLYATNISDYAAQYISQIVSLREVYTHSTSITDKGAAAILTLPNLSGINLNWTRIGYSTFVRMADRKHLRKVKVRGNSITDSCLQQLSNLKGVEIFDVGENSLTNQAFEVLANHWQQVREIELDKTQVTDAVVDHLIKWPLESLRYSRDQITDKAIDRLLQVHPSCRIAFA